MMGSGFKGQVVATVIGSTEDTICGLTKFVIGMKRSTTGSYWKIPLLSRDIPSVKTEVPEVATIIKGIERSWILRYSSSCDDYRCKSGLLADGDEAKIKKQW